MPTDKTIYFHFYNDINTVIANKFVQFVSDAIATHKPTHIYFFISSNGGQVDAGFVIYNYIISLKPGINVTMHNVGSIDSIANIIFICGHQRYTTPYSSFLYHGVNYTFVGPQSFIQITEALSQVSGMEDRIIGILANNTQLTITDLKSLFQQGQSKDASFALSKGIVQEIKETSLSPGDIFLVMNFV